MLGRRLLCGSLILGLALDGVEDAVEGGLHANHLALHDLVATGDDLREPGASRREDGERTRYWPSRRERRLGGGEGGGSDMSGALLGTTSGDSLDGGGGEWLDVLLLWFLKHALLPAQLAATTRGLEERTGPGGWTGRRGEQHG